MGVSSVESGAAHRAGAVGDAAAAAAAAEPSAARRRLPEGGRRRALAVDAAASIVVGLVIGAILSVGEAFYATWGLCSFSDPMLWLRALAYGVVAAAVVFAVLRWWAWYQVRDASARPPSALTRRVASTPFWRRAAVCAVVIALLWVPVFLAFYPGNYSSDGPIQATYFLNDGIVDLHWPAAHTLLLAGALSLGSSLFGSYDAGVSLFCFAQLVFAACALGYVASKLVEWRVPTWVALALLAVVVLNPVVQAYVVATAKDTLFAIFFVLVVVKLADAARDGSRWTDPAFLAPFVVCALGMCLMRKQGLYVLAVAIVLGVVLARRSWRERGCAVLSVVIAYALMTGFNVAVDAAFEVRSDSAREVASLPSQQIVRTYMYDYDELTDEEIDAIGRYYDLDALEAGRTSEHPWDDTPIGEFYNAETGTGYLAPIADPAKAALKDTAFSEDLGGYLGLYASLLGDHASQYVRAFLWGGLGYLYPSSDVANRWVGLSPWNEFGLTIDAGGADDQVSDYHETSLLPGYEDWIQAGAWDLFSGAPVLSQWVSPALSFYVLLAALLLLARSRRTGEGARFRAWSAWLFALLYAATLFLGPVMCLRYVIPLVMALPVIGALPFVGIRPPLSPEDGDAGRAAPADAAALAASERA